MKKKYITIEKINKVEEPMVAYEVNINSNPLSIIESARKGISFSKALELADKMSLSQLEFANILHISLRTLQRYEVSKVLDADESSKIIQLQSINNRGVQVFGDQKSFNLWLRTSLISLTNKTPIQYFDTPFGFQLISQILGRIEHGIFA